MYTQYSKDRKFVTSLITGAILLGVGAVINSYAVQYVDKNISNSVTDIVLSNTSVYNVDGIFVYGAIFLAFVILVASLKNSRRAPFVLKSIALLTFIRSFFISLTHISPYPGHVAISSTIFSRSFPSLFTGNDLFFSGHTGVPFLMALIFWEYPFWRYTFLAFSVLFSVVVLLGHLHYSIDVVSAFFITFTIFYLAKVLFKKDWERE